MGPGLEGTARLVVVWQAYQAVPAPSSVGLALLGGLLVARRRR
jgi:hypothetical protein